MDRSLPGIAGNVCRPEHVDVVTLLRPVVEFDDIVRCLLFKRRLRILEYTTTRFVDGRHTI